MCIYDLYVSYVYKYIWFVYSLQYKVLYCTHCYISYSLLHTMLSLHITLHNTMVLYAYIVIYNTPTATLPMKYYNLERWEMEEYHNKQRQQASAAYSSSSSSVGGDVLGMYMNIGYIHTYCIYTLLYTHLLCIQCYIFILIIHPTHTHTHTPYHTLYYTLHIYLTMYMSYTCTLHYTTTIGAGISDEERIRLQRQQNRAEAQKTEFDRLKLQMTLNKSKTDEMRKQNILYTQLQIAYKSGDITTQKRLERLLAPEEEKVTVKHPWA